jgi:hypothetical protein
MSSNSPLRILFQIQRWGLSHHTFISNVLQFRKYSIDPEIQGQLQAVSDALTSPTANTIPALILALCWQACMRSRCGTTFPSVSLRRPWLLRDWLNVGRSILPVRQSKPSMICGGRGRRKPRKHSATISRLREKRSLLEFDYWATPAIESPPSVGSVARHRVE